MKASAMTIEFHARVVFAVLLLLQAPLVRAVSAVHCPAEQQAYIQATIDSQISPESRQLMTAPGSAASTLKYVQDEVENARKRAVETDIPWHITDANKMPDAASVRRASEFFSKTIRENADVIASFQTRPWARMADDRFSPTTYQKNLARDQLARCFFGERLREFTAGGVVPQAVERARVVSDCPTKNVESVNRALEEVDAQLASFRDSPLGSQRDVATPTLQVLMWATETQATAIRRYCPDSAGFTERLIELDASFKAAQQACLQIQSRPEICKPGLPDALMTAHEDAKRRAASAANSASQALGGVSGQKSAPSVCSSDLSKDDFMACMTTSCVEQNLHAVQTNGGCLVCGNLEGSLGTGFQWRACHRTSQGVSGAR